MDRNISISFLTSLLLVLLISTFFHPFSAAFKSDELLLQDDEEFGLEGGSPQSPPHRSPDFENVASTAPSRSHIRGRRSDIDSSSTDSKSVQFSLEHAFGDGDREFTHAGSFTARLKSSPHGGQTLTKLRFSRNEFTNSEKNDFERLLEDDGYYTIRLSSNVVNSPGKDYVVSSVRARCLSRESLNEHFVIQMDGINIIAVSYGSPGSCQYPRLKRLPSKWSFNSYTVLKNSEQARRSSTFAEDLIAMESAESVEGLPPPEKTFWAKYWMYMIPAVFIVLNIFTQAMNMAPEENAATGQQVQQRAASAPVRRR